MELALCLKRLFSCTVYQCVSRRSQVGLKPCGFEAWFRSRRCGYVVGLAPQGVGGGPSLCLPPGRGAGLSLKTPLNTPARHCGGTPVRRRRTDAPRRGREPLSLRLLAEVHRDAGPPLEPWILRLVSAAEADSRSPRPIKYAKTDACLAATGRNPRRRRRRGRR